MVNIRHFWWKLISLYCDILWRVHLADQSPCDYFSADTWRLKFLNIGRKQLKKTARFYLSWNDNNTWDYNLRDTVLYNLLYLSWNDNNTWDYNLRDTVLYNLRQCLDNICDTRSIFYAKFDRFEFRVFLFLEQLPYQGFKSPICCTVYLELEGKQLYTYLSQRY